MHIPSSDCVWPIYSKCCIPYGFPLFYLLFPEKIFSYKQLRGNQFEMQTLKITVPQVFHLHYFLEGPGKADFSVEHDQM